MIPVSLTVGLSWNFDILFAIQFRTPPPLEFAKKFLWRKKYASHEAVQDGDFNPFSFSLTFGNSIRAITGKIEESQKIARNTAIAVGRHVSPLRSKGWVIHNWGSVRICVGILRGSNWDLFLGCFIILKFFLCDYLKLCEGFLLPVD